jgi:hypothetical protein
MTITLSGSSWREMVVSRDLSGTFTVWIDGTSYGSVTDNTFTTCAQFYIEGVASAGWAIDDIFWSNQILVPTDGTPANVQSVWESAVIDQGASVTAEGVFTASDSAPAGTSITYYTRTSDTGVGGWEAWVAATPGQPISSVVKRYIQVKIVLACPQDDGLHNSNTDTPAVSQIIVSWYFGTGQSKWSSAIDFNFSHDDTIMDLQEQVSDTLGGDTAVINAITVSTAPLILSGADADTVWQGTTGSPPGPIAAANPLNVSAGTITYNLDISGGMDISKMTGSGAIGTGFTGPACVVCVGDMATGTAAISFIHPTNPVLTLTITGPGTITDLRVIGKSYKNNDTPYLATASDAASIAKHHKRTGDPVQNNYIVNANIAQLVANKIILNQKDAPKWIPSMPISAKLNLQPGDRIYVTETNSGITAAYYVIGFTRQVQPGDLSMTVALIKVPV